MVGLSLYSGPATFNSLPENRADAKITQSNSNPAKPYRGSILAFAGARIKAPYFKPTGLGLHSPGRSTLWPIRLFPRHSDANARTQKIAARAPLSWGVRPNDWPLGIDCPNQYDPEIPRPRMNDVDLITEGTGIRAEYENASRTETTDAQFFSKWNQSDHVMCEIRKRLVNRAGAGAGFMFIEGGLRG